jgi:Flp pilus assembly protein TadG
VTKNHSANDKGQVMILTAILLSVFMLGSAFVIDGGYGLFQSRQAQNASDFASLAASSLTPCNSGTNISATQMQKTVQDVINDNDSAVGTNWTAKYLDGNGNAISNATFSGATTYTPPTSACGVAVNATGSWNTTLAKFAGVNSASSSQNAGAIGGGSVGANLAIASLLPYARHTIYAGAIGQFSVVGSMFDNSVAQCNNRDDSCKNYSQCSTGTPTSNIVCYGDSADVFQSATESISGTLYSVAPVPTDPCFYPSPASGNDPVMNSRTYSSYYSTYGCGSEFSQATNAMAYGGIDGNTSAVGDPLASLPDPSANSGAATECNGASSPTTYTTTTVTSGSLNPGVYSNTVTITGSVTLNPCMSNGSTTSPGLYVFKKGVEICPKANATVTGNDVMLFAINPPSSTFSDNGTSTTGYCAPASGASNTVPDGITVGGLAKSTVTLTGPDSGVYKGIALYQSRSVDANIGLDDGWTTTSGNGDCSGWWCTGSGCHYNCNRNTYTPDDANITINGVVYDNSFTNEPSNEVFSSIGGTYGGPYGALCTGTTATDLSNDPTPCPGVPSTSTLGDTSGTVAINGAVIVDAFGTMGGTTSAPLGLTITFESDDVSLNVGNLRLIF